MHEVRPTVFAVDDETAMLRVVSRTLEPEGFRVVTFERAEDALDRFDIERPDIVVTDLRMPGKGGFELISAVRRRDEDVHVIVVTAYSSVESAVRAVKAGAYDFIPKPFDPEHLVVVVQRAAENRRLRLENIGLRRELGKRDPLDDIVGTSSAIREVKDLVEKVRTTDSTVLITGESGTGKELVARAIHFGSRRQDGRFLPLNCGALPDQLLESELFGYEKGAFSGAVNRKPGLFELADGGTVLLDEIESISPAMQVKLLRFLEDRSFFRLGGSEPVEVDVRILAATNEDLARAVHKGTFRKDLYFRLNVVPVDVPPLRERPEDIPLLLGHFVAFYARQFGKAVEGVDEDALRLLRRHRWSGNVRELRNAVERAVTLGEEPLLAAKDFPGVEVGGLMEDQAAVQPELTDLKTHERRYIRRVLAHTGGNKSRAAKILGIDYTTLLRKLKNMDIAVVD